MPAMPVFEMPTMPDMSAFMPVARRQNSNVQSNVGQTGEITAQNLRKINISTGNFLSFRFNKKAGETQILSMELVNLDDKILMFKMVYHRLDGETVMPRNLLHN